MVHVIFSVLLAEPDRDTMLLRIDGCVAVGEGDLEQFSFNFVSGSWTELCLEDLD